LRRFAAGGLGGWGRWRQVALEETDDGGGGGGRFAAGWCVPRACARWHVTHTSSRSGTTTGAGLLQLEKFCFVQGPSSDDDVSSGATPIENRR
jgi:hypothetical protein